MSEEKKILDEQVEQTPAEQPVEEKKVVETKVEAKAPVSKKTIGIIAGVVAAIAVIAVILVLVLGGGNNNANTNDDNNTPSGDNSTPNDDNNTPSGDNNTPSGDNNQPGGDNNQPGGDVVVDKTYTLGMGVVVSLESSKTGNAQVDATVATVVLDENGKIVDCKIDVAQNKASLSDGAFTFAVIEKTKKELGYDYNMSKWGSDNNGDNIVLEWFEQAAIFEQYVIGKTAEEVKNLGTQFVNNHYISSDDALLTAGCTIQITDFITAIVKACEDDQATTFKYDGTKEFTLNVAANSYDSGSTKAGETDGTIKMYTDFGAAVVVDGKIVAALNDAIQPDIKFNDFDEIVSKTYKGTKRELKEDYNMAKWGTSLVGNATVAEWYIQSAAFSAYAVGKTPAELMAIPTQVASNGYIISGDDALLNAGCTMSIDAIMAVVAKAAGYVVPAEDYTLGMGVVVSLESSKTGTAQVDATVAVVVLDKDGKIVACKIDVAQNKASLSDGAFTFAVIEKTKKELGYDYNMSKWGSDNNGDGIVLEWFEQAAIFEQYVIGKTAEEVKNLGTQFVNNHYISSDDALLTAGCTMQITDFITAIVKACEDDQAVTFQAVPGTFGLGVAANSYDSGSTKAGEIDGTIKMYTDFGAAVVVDDVVVAALNDAIQPDIKFNDFDEIVSKTYKGTKRELKEDYNMAKWGTSLVGNATVAEWYIQSAAFSAHVVGMTAEQIKDMPTQTASNGYIISGDDALLSAGCTMSIDAIIDVVVDAVGYAK